MTGPIEEFLTIPDWVGELAQRLWNEIRIECATQEPETHSRFSTQQLAAILMQQSLSFSTLSDQQCLEALHQTIVPAVFQMLIATRNGNMPLALWRWSEFNDYLRAQVEKQEKEYGMAFANKR